MKFKNSDLFPILITILSFDGDTKQITGGLLTESITLGTKRKLQKLREEIYKHREQFIKDENEVKIKAKPEELEAELQTLNDEEVEVNQDFINMSFIEEIKSSTIYDFNIIEKFAK